MGLYRWVGDLGLRRGGMLELGMRGLVLKFLVGLFGQLVLSLG